MAEPTLELTGLRHTFRSDTAGLAALDGVDLTLELGAFVVVVGANGSGKSTLLDVIAGRVLPDEGRVRLEGVDVTRWPEHARARRIARVFQSPDAGTAPRLTIAENLALAAHRGRRLPGLGRPLPRAARRELAERVATLGMSLEHRMDTPAAALSGGERQALTLLMATLVRPAVLLLDEHTAALDPQSAERVLRLTREIVECECLTTLMVTHDMHQAATLGNRVLMMHRGRILHDLPGARTQRLREQDLLDRFDEIRNADLLDERAADLLRKQYV